MNEFVFTLKAFENEAAFKVTSPNSLEPFINILFSLFPGVDFQNKKIECLQYASEELRERITEFVKDYIDKLPQANEMAAFFNRIPGNEPFFFIPYLELDLRSKLSLSNYLSSLKNKDQDFEILENGMDELFGELFKKYSMFIFPQNRRLIGQKDKAKRKCRFCKNEGKCTFNNKAHAISEALGNKHIILLDECDQCNERFSKTIEPDIIEFLSFFRTINGIQGKGGIKKFKGKNFSIEKTDVIKIEFESENRDSFGLPLNIPLKSYQDICVQNIYKSLCKYFISLIPSEYLPRFEKTIEWINGKIEISMLPKIATLLVTDILSSGLLFVIYLRKSSNTDLPFAVGEFHFAMYRYVFIVPATDSDSISFIDENDYKRFWTNFKHYDKSTGWYFKDFSDNAKKEFVIDFNLHLNEKN